MLTILGNQAHTSGLMGTVDYAVIHATVSPCKPGGARANARYFQSPDAGGLAHYIVDPSETVQSCDEGVACWHCPPLNKRGIGVELCDPQSGDAARWLDEPHQQMLTRAAALFADICTHHRLPMVYVDHDGLLRGERGITTHHDAVLAWHKSTHTDPGPGFPMGQFIGLVNAAARPAPTPEDDVALSDADVEKVAQRVAALLRPIVATHDDIKVALHGTKNNSHPANIDSIYADTQAIRKAVKA